MDHIGILERAIQTTVRHRALWVLGFLWALVGGCEGPSGGGGGGPNLGFSDGDNPFGGEIEGLPFLGHTLDVGAMVGLIAGLVCVLLLLAIIMMVIRYVLQAGVFRSLDRLEVEGVGPTVRGAWREGWNRRTWRLWLQNLIVDIPLVIVVIATLLLVAAPAIVGLIAGGGEPAAVFILMTVGLFFGWLLTVIAVSVAVDTLKQLWWRAAVVGDEPFLAALRTGWRLAWGNLSDVAIMALLMIGAGIVWGAVVLVLAVVFLVVTGGVAVLPAYLIFQSGQNLVPALLYGLPAAFVTFVVPLTFAGGLFLIFEASVWTQVYHALVRRTAGEA